MPKQKLANYYPRDIKNSLPGKPVNYKSPSSKPEILKRINGPLVIADLTSFHKIDTAVYTDAGFIPDTQSGRIKKTDSSADMILTSIIPEVIPDDASVILPYKIWMEHHNQERLFPLFTPWFIL